MFLVNTRISLIVCRSLVEGFRLNRRITAPELADKYKINLRMINTSLRQLVRAGILNSQTGGHTPGFIFSKDPSEIKLYDVIAALEGHSRMECCRKIISGVECDISNCDECLVYITINKGLDDLSDSLKSISLSDYLKQPD